MPSLSEWTLRKFYRFVLPFIVVACAGLALRLGYRDTWPVQDTIHVLGDALAVGAVIALTLEFFASRVLIDDAAKELSERLVGEGLPRRLQAAIADVVHHTSIVADEVQVRYAIAVDPQDASQVIVTVHRSYRATNHGRANVEYTPLLAEEHFHSPEFISLHCDPGDAGGVYSLIGNQLCVEVDPNSRAHTVRGKSVTLKPHHSDPTSSQCRSSWVYRLTTPSVYSDVISFATPTLDTTIIRDVIPSDFSFTATNDSRWTEHSEGHWVYRQALLPKQHLRVWWTNRGSLA
jgi:hypothetical protein